MFMVLHFVFYVFMVNRVTKTELLMNAEAKCRANFFQ